MTWDIILRGGGGLEGETGVGDFEDLGLISGLVSTCHQPVASVDT